MKVLIVEDEKHNATKLKRKLQLLGRDISVLAVLETIRDTVDWFINNEHPELVFLDIELADGQSFEIFKQVKIPCPIIFTTAYDEYALKAFEVNSIDYLLKPIKEEDLEKAFKKLDNLRDTLGRDKFAGNEPILKLIDELRSKELQSRPRRERFLSKVGQRLVSIEVKDIAYFFTKNKISYLRTNDQRDFVLDYSLDEISYMVDSTLFFRLNRQVIARIEAIEKTHFYFNNKLKINLIPPFDEDVLVSREKSGEFKKWLGE